MSSCTLTWACKLPLVEGGRICVGGLDVFVFPGNLGLLPLGAGRPLLTMYSFYFLLCKNLTLIGQLGVRWGDLFLSGITKTFQMTDAFYWGQFDLTLTLPLCSPRKMITDRPWLQPLFISSTLFSYFLAKIADLSKCLATMAISSI